MGDETRIPGPARTEAEIQRWLTERLEKELELPPDSIHPKKPLSRFGVDSIVAVSLSAELEDWLGQSLPPTLFAEYSTIEALARFLAHDKAKPAGGTPAPTDLAAPARETRPVTRGSDTRDWTPIQQRVRKVLQVLVRILCRLDWRESEALPESGPFVLAANHLSVLDTPILFALLTRPAAFFVSAHMKSFPIARWFLSRVSHTIWVSRGEGDVGAIQSALAVLRSDGVVIVAPEGIITRGGGLTKGRSGAAYLAAAAGVPVVPLAAWGQENALRRWTRLRPVDVAVRIGSPLYLTQGNTSAKALEAGTEAIMIALARMLPPEYRGYYRKMVSG